MNDMIYDKTDTKTFEMEGKCPFGGDRIGGTLGVPPQLSEWYPNRLKVELLHQNGPQANPLGDDFDYAEAFNKIDLPTLKQDIKSFLTSSVAWWPSDYNNYGPQMIRMAWHAAGTYRIADGRGGAGEALQRFAPISSWWDNGNTDKSRRLIWPIKQKYGAALSWGDLMVLTGNCALEIMGFPTYGFGGGRHDAWEADNSTYWGPEVWDPKDVSSFDSMVTRDKRWRGKNGDADYDLENPLGATHQALIYVNPEGPYANGDALGSARDIRISFSRMAMNDEETVALIAGGHAFGKSHGMVKADEVGPPPEIAPIEAMGLGWQNPEGTGFAEYTMTNGIEGSWTPNPTRWDNEYLENLFKFDWVQTKSPAGALQWTPSNPDAPKTPDAHVPGKMNPLMMMTTDIALKVDPEYRKVCEKFLGDFDAFTQACRSIGEPILGRPLHEISIARLLAQLFQVTAQFEMETQPQLLLLQKTMVLIEGVGRRLDPEVNIWSLARPLVEEWARDNRGPEARLKQQIDTVVETLDEIPRLVRNLDRLIGD